jgi:hypothetical protein
MLDMTCGGCVACVCGRCGWCGWERVGACKYMFVMMNPAVERSLFWARRVRATKVTHAQKPP